MKKLVCLGLSMLLLLTMLPALAQTATSEPAGPVSVTIFHTNDVHGRYNSAQGMGYAMMLSYVNEARNAGENVIVLDAGDTLHGTIFATATQGESIIQVMNAIGYAAMSAGNHDFNYGQARLKELAELAQFPILSANLLNSDGSYLLTPYTILEVADKKIGVVGAQNPDMKEAIHPDHIDGIRFEGVEQVKKAVDELRPQVDALIVLCHWGADDAYDPNSSVLAALPGVDLVIDAHSHTELPNIKQVDSSAPVTSTGEYLNNLGMVKLTFAEDGLQIEPSLIPNPKRFEDHALINAIEDIEAAQAEALDVVIGKTDVDLVGERELVRTQETNLGNLACDIFIEVTGADVAMVNGGGIRKSVPQGDITVRDINEVFPFGNYVCVISVTGDTLKQVLEHGYANLPEQLGGFPQIGGMTCTVDITKEKGSRVSDLMIGGQPVDLAKTYTFATNDFLASGGDGYEMLKSAPLLLEMAFMDEVLTSYIKSKAAIAPTVDGRINIVGK